MHINKIPKYPELTNSHIPNIPRIILTFILFLVSVFFNSTNLIANSDGYKISIKISGISDTVCYLANYYGDKTYLADTAIVDKNSRFVFEGDTILPKGIYIVAGQSNNRFFEMIIDKEQYFTITSDVSDINGKIKIKNSENNNLFFDYINFNTAKHKEIESLRKLIKELNNQPDSLNVIRNRIQILNDELADYKLDIIANYPESFISVLFKAMKEPEVSKIPILENGKEDSVYAYQYYKNHFWNNIDVADDRLLRTPVFHQKIEKYFTKVIYQHPDTITLEADKFINKTRPNKETFKYAIWYLTYKYQTSKVMGFDEIFVHMVDNYYSKGEAYWADSGIVETLKNKADALRPILIGEVAPNLILIDTNGSFVSMHHITARNMVILFYESDCGHCKEEIDGLKSWYADNDLGLEVFAVCTDTALTTWKKFITGYNLEWINVNGTRSLTADYHDLYDINMTPTLFLIDENKKIIAKRLKTKQLRPFLENYPKTN